MFLKNKHAALLLLIILLSPIITMAQNSRVVANQWNGWAMYFGNHKLSKKFSLHTEYQWRRSDVVINWQQSLTRIGLDYNVNDNVVTTAGYGFITTYAYGEQPVAFTFNEHRVWEQLMLKNKSGRFNFIHRFRLEHRWLEQLKAGGDGNPVNNGYLYKNRARYMFRVNIPLNKSSMEKGVLFISLYDEVFVNFGKNVNLNIFDQNRAYAALGYQILKNANIQLGYMNQFIQKSDGVHLESNNTLQLALTYNFDFTKKQK